MRISVVIPVYEDRAALTERVRSMGPVEEVVVVDASCRDPVPAGDLPPGIRLVRAARPSRGHQQNVGAALCSGDAIVFLHADTELPAGGIAAVRRALEDAEVAGGGFARRFASPSRILRWTCAVATWRGRRFGWFLGDQAIFVRRMSFKQAGGFRDLCAFEDYDLCRRLKKGGKMVCLVPPVLSSARRFERDGPAWRSLRDLALTLGYLLLGAGVFARRFPGD